MLDLAIFLPPFAVGSVVALGFLLYSCWNLFFARSSGISGAVNCELPDIETGRDALAEHPTSLSWQNLDVITKGGFRKTIVHQSFGKMTSGEMAAIIGPSGAGKSTLLDALAARSAETVKGTVCIDGVPATAAKRSAESAYIPQEDHFIPSLTCFETLMVAARLRGLSASSIRQIVHGSLRSMGLQGARDTQVGGLLPGGLRVRGISGGEKRRLSIACGTIGAPRIIFLDEPTSGLDTSSALVVMRCIRALADADRVVLSSIHQPRASIWDLFDTVLLLSAGRTLYCGSTGQVVNWLSSSCKGCRYIPERHGTVCEWLSDLVSVSPMSMKGNTAEDSVTSAFSHKDVVRTAHKFTEGIMLETAEVVEEKADAQENIGRYPHATIWNQYRVLQGRATMAYARNPANVAGRTLMAVALGVLVGFVFFRKPDGVDGLRQSVGALFFAALLLSLMPYTYMSMFISDRLFFRDDPLQPLYLTAPYYAAVSGINAILSSLNGVIMMLIVYGLVALLHTARAVLLTVLVTVLHSLCSVQLLVFVANLTPNQDLAFVLGVTYTSLSVLLSGFFVRLADMAPFFRGLSYLTYFRYTLTALTRLQFSHREDNCALPVTCSTILETFDVTLSFGACMLGLTLVLVLLHVGSIISLSRLSI